MSKTIKELVEIVDNLPDFTPEEIAEINKHAGAVAKAKGLPAVEDGIVKYCFGADIVRVDRDAAIEAIKSNDVEKFRRSVKRSITDYKPTSEDMSLINGMSNADVDENSVICMDTLACDQQPDRQYDILGTKFLNAGARLCPDKPMCCNHNRSVESSVGKILKGYVKGGALWQRFMLDLAYEDLVRKVMNGIVNKVSISFSSEAKDAICSSCKKSLYSRDCGHYPGWPDEKGETVFNLLKDACDYFETSFVGVPAQPRAGVRRNPVDENTMPKVNADHVNAKSSLVSELAKQVTDLLKSIGGVVTVDEVREHILGLETLEGTKALSEKDIERTNALLEDDSETVGRITNEKLDESNGDVTVPNQPTDDKSKEDPTAAIAPDATAPAEATSPAADPSEKAADAPATPAPVEDATTKALLDAALVTNELLKSLIEKTDKQNELLEKAVSAPEVTPATPADAAVKAIDMSKPGSMEAFLNKVFSPTQPQA
jgi:hypothetical protein